MANDALDTLTLRNFKAHRDTSIPLGRLTVLVGPNGAGKSTVLQALEILGRLSEETLGRILLNRFDPTALVRAGGDGFQLDLRVNAKSSFVKVAVSGVPNSTRQEVSWSVDAEGRTSSSINEPFFTRGNAPHLLDASPFFHPSRVYRLRASRIAEPSHAPQVETRVGDDGALTATVLAALKLAAEDRFKRIEDRLRALVPTVERVRVRRAEVRQNGQSLIGEELLLDFKGAPNVPAAHVSEGTLILLALLVILESETRPRAILLEDVEHALHPQAQQQLATLLRELVEQDDTIRIVATTHSPYILDPLDPSQIVVLYPRDGGDVVARPLSEHPNAGNAKGVLTAGQLWTVDPEKWVLETSA